MSSLARMIGASGSDVQLRQATVVGTPVAGIATIRFADQTAAAVVTTDGVRVETGSSTDDDIAGVRCLTGATIAAGDAVWVLHTGGVLLILGAVGPPAVANSEWTTWAPTFSNFTVGNAAVVARYAKIGRTVPYFIRVTLGSTSVMGTNPTFSLPVASAPGVYNASTTEIGWGSILDAGSTNYRAVARIATASTAGVFAIGTSGTWAAHGIVTPTSPMTWVVTDNFEIMGQYEAAA